MLPEITTGVNVVRKFLDKKIPEEKLDNFSSSLSAILQNRFTGHWRPTQPNHGNAYRSIHTSVEKIDPVLRAAADQAAISNDELTNALPFTLTVWIDPAEVAFRIGTNGSICHTAVQQREQTITPEPAATGPTSIAAPAVNNPTPPPSPMVKSIATAPKSPLLPLPLSRRPSETNMAPPSPARSLSRDGVFGSPQRARRLSLDTRNDSRTSLVSRSPSRALLEPVAESPRVPPSPRRPSVMDLPQQSPYPLVY